MHRILLTGGSTGGPVVPLLAVYEYLKEADTSLEFFWVGTYKGYGRALVERYKIPYKSITAGKFHRFFTLSNLIQPFLFIYGFFQALFFLKKFKPDIVVTAGGFVSVPVFLAARLLKIKSLVHQQDIKPGMANEIMAQIATKVTVALDLNKKAFPGRQAFVVGNPVRTEVRRIKNQELRIKNEAYKFFNLEQGLPVLLITGGGTGAQQINKIVWKILPRLLEFCQIIHIIGKGKKLKQDSIIADSHENAMAAKHIRDRYRGYEILDEDMPKALAAADVVVSRAGFSSLTELSYLGKPALVIPMPGSHQELNAEYFESQGAVEVLKLGYSLSNIEREDFVFRVKSLIEDKAKQQKLSRNIQQVLPPNGTQRLAQEVLNLLK